MLAKTRLPLARRSLALVALLGCVRERTEIVVRVDSDLPWGRGRRLQSVMVQVHRGSASGPLLAARTLALGEGPGAVAIPFTVGLVATASDDRDPVWIEGLGCGAPDGCTRATAITFQRAVVRFVRGQTLELPLLLSGACAGVSCALEERCSGEGRCVAATNAEAQLRPYSGPSDAAAPLFDGGVDAPAADAVALDVLNTPDAAIADAGPTDTGPTDTGPTDTGPVDAGPRCPRDMVYIPAGSFIMGTVGNALHIARLPLHAVQLSAYCIDRTEVTVAAYERCVAATCVAPRTASGTDGDACNWGTSRSDHPVNCVTWAQARAYCNWLGEGSDLPTEAQWEYAARGTTMRTFPWGEGPPYPSICFTRQGSPGTTCAVGSNPTSNTPTGIADLAGNVSEWIADWFAAYTGDTMTPVINPQGPSTAAMDRVKRGGSWWDGNVNDFFSGARASNAPMTSDARIGFRCASPPRW
jgi:sulfatase modifying factor 1